MITSRNRRSVRTCPTEENNWRPQQQQKEKQKSIQISSLDTLLEQPMTNTKSITSNDGKRFKINRLPILSLLLVFWGGFTIGWIEGKYRNGRNSDHLTAYNVVNEVEVTQYRDLMKITVEVLESNDIRYWAVGGTALGALRNSPPGLIRWDDNMDFGILEKDMDKMMDLFKVHPEFDVGDKLFRDKAQLQLRLKKSPKNMRKEYQMNIFGYDWYDDGPNGGAYYIINRKGGLEYPRSNYLIHEIEAPVDCPFWDLTIKCPNDLETQLLREVGLNVMTEGLIGSHFDEKTFLTRDRFKGTRFDLTRGINDHNGYLPAMNLDLLKKIKFVNDEL
mmetsp:Transcript_3165/g.7042  ORF Transcript_3165/g.7042 Transcript_3165/m.7042 type:complete len:332 (+) Transcript_3165:185-1180(+)